MSSRRILFLPLQGFVLLLSYLKMDQWHAFQLVFQLRMSFLRARVLTHQCRFVPHARLLDHTDSESEGVIKQLDRLVPRSVELEPFLTEVWVLENFAGFISTETISRVQHQKLLNELSGWRRKMWIQSVPKIQNVVKHG